MHVTLSHGVQSTDLKACRQLASDITARGAKLHELLGREVELRVRDRTTIMSLAVWHKDNLPDQNILLVFVCLSPGRICARRPYLRQWTLRSWREEYTAVSPRLKYAPHSPLSPSASTPSHPPPLPPLSPYSQRSSECSRCWVIWEVTRPASRSRSRRNDRIWSATRNDCAVLPMSGDRRERERERGRGEQEWRQHCKSVASSPGSPSLCTCIYY